MTKSKPTKKKHRLVRILLIIAAVLVLGLSAGLLADAPARRELADLIIGNVDFAHLKDGSYIGQYCGKTNQLRDVTLEVTISDGKITCIDIIKGALDKYANPAKLSGDLTMDDVFQNVIQSQSLQVDAVSGATLTTKAHLKALENALLQAQN